MQTTETECLTPMPVIVADISDRWLVLSEDHYKRRMRHKTAAHAEAEAARLAVKTGGKFYVLKLGAVAHPGAQAEGR